MAGADILRRSAAAALLLFSLLMFPASAAAIAAAVSPENNVEYRPGELLVGFRSSGQRRSASVHQKVGATVADVTASGVELVRLPQGMSVEAGIEQYAADDAVAFAEPNYIVHKASIPNDSRFSEQWWLHNTGQLVVSQTGVADADVDAPEAWDLSTGSASIIVAVVDTGVDYNHTDLSANMWSNAGETDCSDGVDNDGNGYIDDCRGWNFFDNANDPRDNSVDGHGTNIAGIIGAQGNNGSGVSGMNWNVTIMPLKILDLYGDGDVAKLIKAIEYAVDKGARVINASLTYSVNYSSQAAYNAIELARNAGVLVVAAAGNSGSNNDYRPQYPASYLLDNVISVAASENRDSKPSFSNFGGASVHLAAPGFKILSLLQSNTYGYLEGSSQSAAVVSGAAALLMAYRPSYDYRQVRETLMVTSDPVAINVISRGRVNAYNALSSPFSTLTPAPPSLYHANALSTSTIELRWRDNSIVETGYSVERASASTGPFVVLSALATNATAYTDSTLTEATDYVYRVQADNANGSSRYSQVLSLSTPPNAPASLAASQFDATSVSITWVDTSSGEGGFTLERKSSAAGDFFRAVALLGSNTESHLDISVAPFMSYTYRVRATRGAASSAYSNESTVFVKGQAGSGCFIATRVYGSYEAPEVRVLRAFRDRVLLTSSAGRAFVRAYYALSPAVADALAHVPVLSKTAAHALNGSLALRSTPLWGARGGALISLLAGCVLALRRRQRLIGKSTAQDG